MDVFKVSLSLLKQSIAASRPGKSDLYRIVFLVPANSDANLKDMLKGYILEVFTALQD